jgi:hypothetical protein
MIDKERRIYKYNNTSVEIFFNQEFKFKLAISV